MLDFPRWKVWAVLITTIVGVAFAIPSFFPQSVVKAWPAFVPKPQFQLGLDLKGGSHLLLEAETGDVAKQRVQAMEESVRTEMRRASPRIDIGDISTTGGTLSFFVRNVTQIDAAVDKVRALTSPIGLTGQRDWDVAVRDSTRVVMTPTASGLAKATDDALEAARDVVARRIDPNGTSEVTVVRQGDNRILVQVPGLQNPDRLKALLGKTAKLEFKLVALAADGSAVLPSAAGPGTEVLPYAEGAGGSIVVQRRIMVSGDELSDATQGNDATDNRPVVNIRFNSQGGRKFGRVTQENVGKPFAIILDGVVLSAPNINEPILGGSAQIAGSFTVESANELAVSLRSGKLPIALKVVEERTVGPDLGADSIRKGLLAGVVATLALIAFMIVTYFRFGVYTAIALIVNAFLILGIMAIFNATLTLPGIAGFVLTIGAAVDANVLIFERIREEVRRGRHTLSAVEFGFKEASRAIFDANITNVISATIMFFFGSGPIRGFAVVLMIGIFTSVFTGVTLTRLMVADYLRRSRPKELVI